jgi:hypothetical protein
MPAGPLKNRRRETGAAKAAGLASEPLLDPLAAIANLLDSLFDC